MRRIKYISSVLALAVACGLTVPVKAATVEVEFSGRLVERMGRLDLHERILEEELRNDGIYQRRSVGSRMRKTKSRYADVGWAGETLLPDLEEFGLMNLTRAMSVEAMKRAGLDDLPGILRVKIQNIQLANYGVTELRGPQSYAKGEMEYVDADGNVLSVKIWADLSRYALRYENSKGQDFAFSSRDGARRVGPVLAAFVHQGIERLFDAKDVPRPVLARY